jgi:hypothetical protein
MKAIITKLEERNRVLERENHILNYKLEMVIDFATVAKLDAMRLQLNRSFERNMTKRDSTGNGVGST